MPVEFNHYNLSPGNIHGLVQWRVADLAARNALSITSKDVGKLCVVNNTDYYIVNSVSPTVWGTFVKSIFGRYNDVVAQYGDYDTAKISILNDGVTTLTDLKDLTDTQWSTGVIGYGNLLTDLGTGSVSVAASDVVLRATDNDQAELKIYRVPSTSLTPTDTVTNYIYAEYNSGTPRYITTTTERTDTNTNILVGRLYREGTTLHINQSAIVRANDNNRRTALRFVKTQPYQHESGANISEVGTRNIAITSGAFWECTNRFTTNAFNSSTGGTFTYAYRDGVGGWVYQTSQTQINNTQYDDNSGTLQTLTNNRYAVAWVYLETDSDVVILYGQGNYSLTDANESSRPASTPPRLHSTARLIGKIVLEKSASVFTSINSAFVEAFSVSQVNDHNALAGLQGGTTDEYYHLTSTQHADLTTGIVGDTQHIHNLSGVVQPSKLGSPTPTSTDNFNEILNYHWSAGVISGCSITDNANGTVSVAAGEAMLRSSASETSQLYLCTITANTSVSLTDGMTNYILADYNVGTPTISVTTSITGFNCMDKCIIGTVSREGTHLHIIDATRQNVDGNRKLRRKYLETEPFKWTPGGTILGTTGLALTLTAGKFWYALDPVTHGAFDTSVAGTGNDREFSTYYRNGSGGWTKTTGVKTLNNTQYDDGDGTLGTIGNNKYLVHWVFLALGEGSTAHTAVVYGQAEYANVADAQAATVPPTLPPVFEGTTVIVGRVVILKSATTVAVTESAFSVTFSTSTPNAHNNLSLLQGGTAGEYFHLTNAEYTGTGTGNFVRTLSPNLTTPVLAGYTVATLPAAGTAGRMSYVTDALAPTFLGIIVGGGSVVTPVFDNGTNWVAH